MTYDIYFHNDFDGRASAAVMSAYFRSRGDSVAHYIAMSYGKEGKWFDDGFFKNKNPAIVVDFTYHPGATWWFDHHATAFKREDWRKRFKPDAQHRLDPKYRSCCHFVYDTLTRDFGWKAPKHFKELARWLDVIDGAGYRSARETVEMPNAALQINAFIEGSPHGAKENARVIRLLAEHPLASVVKTPAIVRGVRRIKKEVAKSLQFYKKHLVVSERSTFIDLTLDPLHGLLRFIPYYLYPKTIYSVRIKRKGSLWYLGVGANPWRRSSNKLDIGTMMRRYRGGGHKDVGATEFRTKKEAVQALEEINGILNGLPKRQ